MSRIDKYASKTSKLEEMAAIDFKDIDLDGSAESIAKQFVDNYKKRTGKDFNAQAAAGIKKTLKDREDVDAIVAAARKYGEVKEAKPHAVRSKESNEKKKEKEVEKHDTMSKNVEAAAKRAHDVYTKESLINNLRRNSGLSVLNEEEDSKEEQIAFVNGMKAKLKSIFSEEVKEGIATEKDEQGKNDFDKEAIKVIKKKVFGDLVYKIDEDLSEEFDKVLLSKKEIAGLLKTILTKQVSEGINESKKSKKTKTAKCPNCDGKYLVQTGYCLSCREKVAKPSVDTDGGCESKKDKKKKKVNEGVSEEKPLVLVKMSEDGRMPTNERITLTAEKLLNGLNVSGFKFMYLNGKYLINGNPIHHKDTKENAKGEVWRFEIPSQQ